MTDENTQDVSGEDGSPAPKAPVVPDAVVQKQYPRQNVLDASFDIKEPFSLKVAVHLWEVMTEEVIAARINQLEQSDLQIRATMEKIEANGGRGNADYTQLESRSNEVVRQLEHARKTLKPGDIVFKAKTEGTVDIRIGSDWNKSLERHVVVENGFVARILPRSPV